MIKRQEYWTKLAHKGYGSNKLHIAKGISSNVVGSMIVPEDARSETLHAPVIDFDFPCEIIPSSTPGHNHLYIDHPLTWRKYKKLLKTLLQVGLIEKGWYDSAMRDRQSIVRKPSEAKKNAQVAPLQQAHQVRLEEISQALNSLVAATKPESPPESAETYF